MGNVNIQVFHASMVYFQVCLRSNWARCLLTVLKNSKIFSRSLTGWRYVLPFWSLKHALSHRRLEREVGRLCPDHRGGFSNDSVQSTTHRYAV